MDLSAISDALALRYATPTPPAGYKAITGSTARPPNNIPNTPYVVVWPQSGDVMMTGGMVDGTHEFSVVMYYSRSEADVPREMVALQKWVGILLDRTYGQLHLGFADGSVLKAIPVKWEFGTAVYGGDTYEVITLTIHVWTKDYVSLVS